MKKFLMSLCALLLALSLCGACAEDAVVLTMIETVTVGQPDAVENNDELFDAYVEGLFSVSKRPSKAPRAVGDRLTGTYALCYGFLKSSIQEVASGAQTSTSFTITAADLGLEGQAWTAEELGVKSIRENGEVTQDAKEKMLAKACDLRYMLDVLLADLPYDLYWYQKVIGTNLNYTISVLNDGTNDKLSFGSDGYLVFKFTVAEQYAASTYETDPTRITAANEAVARAHTIVSAHAGEKDYDKLHSYRQEICDLTSYNTPASQTSGMYGDPWQMVYVFDGDPETTVVCEGYSKAFQYLCDLSTFRNKVTSYIVTGYMSTAGGSGGKHMWNMVAMPDGSNYLVDVTNCDSGTVGAPDQLFLAGYTTQSSYGYTLTLLSGSTITYEFGSDMKKMYTAEELAIAAANYVPPIEVPDPADMTTLTLPAGLVTLESAALEGVAAQRIVLPAGLRTIESRAFAACPNLVYINLPAEIETIAADAFADCAAERIFVECAGDTAENGIFATETKLYAIP